MKIVKLAIEDLQEIKKKSDGTPLYLIKVLGNRGRDKNGEYLKDVSLFTDEKTFKTLQCDSEDVILKFVGDKSVRG